MTKSNSIFISGGKATERALVSECITWCIQKLLPRYRTLDIKVRIKPMVDMGCCTKLDDKGRQFKIHLQQGMSLYDMISSVCHEMVHLKQFARRELRWCNKYHNNMWKKAIHNYTPYDSQPWEKEAYRFEKRLAIEFFTSTSNI